MTSSGSRHVVTEDQAGITLAAFLRALAPDLSWKKARQRIGNRHVRINDELCPDPARRLSAGEVVELLDRPAAKPREPQSVVIRHLDDHVVVVEKPSGLSTVRHPAERNWNEKRRALAPTLEDVVTRRIAAREAGGRLRIVHRLDKETSGLVVFARSVRAERGLGAQFKAHVVQRKYHAVVPGNFKSRTIRSFLVRDRGDGRRGGTLLTDVGKEAITHVEVRERYRHYTLVECRLETGRTHQIRIHLAELGHPVCGEKVYRHAFGEAPIPDASGAPRLALHAIELGFEHPITERPLCWQMPFPPDLEGFVERLRSAEG